MRSPTTLARSGQGRLSATYKGGDEKVKRAMLSGAVALMLVAGVPASATAADGCTLGSPNIIRDVTDCVASLTEGCSPLGSPNIITDILECLR